MERTDATVSGKGRVEMSSGAGRTAQMRCTRRMSPPRSDLGSRGTCWPTAREWPVKCFENRTLFGWSPGRFEPMDSAQVYNRLGARDLIDQSSGRKVD